MKGANAAISWKLNFGPGIKKDSYQLQGAASDRDVKRTIIRRTLIGIGARVHQHLNASDVASLRSVV